MSRKYMHSHPNTALFLLLFFVEVAPMSLCVVDLVVEDDIDLIDSTTNSKTDGAGVLKAVTVLTIYLECILVDLQS